MHGFGLEVEQRNAPDAVEVEHASHLTHDDESPAIDLREILGVLEAAQHAHGALVRAVADRLDVPARGERERRGQ